MSAGKVVPRQHLHSICNGVSSVRKPPHPFLGCPPGHPNMPLTPPDSPSSDDEEKNSRYTAAAATTTTTAITTSVRKADSSSGSEDEGVPAHKGRAGGASDVGGILIERGEVRRAWPTREQPSSGAAGIAAASGREKEGASASRSGGSGTECHHASGEGGSGGKDPRSATVCVMQQKGGAQPQMNSSASSSSSSILSDSRSSTMGGPAPPPPPPPPLLRSALKRSGQRSRSSSSSSGHRRVSINEAKNEIVEADYVILVRDDDDEPQLVSIRTFDLGLSSSSSSSGGGSSTAVDHVTLSPPEGYKDVFGHAVHETLADDSDTESQGVDVTSGWGINVHDPDCPRANLPDVVTSQHCSSKSLTVENVRHHDQMMENNKTNEGDEEKVAKTGILKGGKLWKNGGDVKKPHKLESEKSEKGDEPRRSVRFSGRDEYTTLETTSFDKIPFEMSNEAALACFLSPKFRELSELLGEEQGNWHLELSPIAIENAISDVDSLPDGNIIHHPTCAKHKHKMEEHQMDDEQISESVQRYDEMRRRIAAAEGRDNNSTCSDESKSSSDSQSSDSTTTESRIRRLENTDVAQVAGGVMRSNSEVRRAIERNALRRSLIRFAEARKKDTNKNDKNEKQESSLIERLKWLTASEDATNGNANDSVSENDVDLSSEQKPEGEEEKPRLEESKINCTIEQYRKLAEMFNRTTSFRGNDISVPGDVREWKLESELFPCEKIIADLENDELPPGTLTFTAVPAVSVCEQISDEESEKLIYSGGIRYTKEGTLPTAENQGHKNNTLSVQRERTSFGPNSDSYTMDDIDEVLHDDRSSSVPSSSQSSPRLSGRSDVDGTSTAESGYSSNETNSELSQLLPPELDELAEFVKQDAGRMDRLRKRYDEPEDHGFCRRPSVRGIKPRFGSTTDLLKQMANQLVPPNASQPSAVGSHMTWPYRDGGEEEAGKNHQQRRRLTGVRSNTLPALQEDVPYAPQPDSLYNQIRTNSGCPTATSVEKHPRIVHVYSSTGDLRATAPNRLPPDSNETIRPVGQVPPQRAQSYTSIPQVSQYGPAQMAGSSQGGISSSDQHLPTCVSRRPASIHGHAPTDMLVSGPQHPTPRLHHTLSLQSYPRSQSHEDQGYVKSESSHVHLGPRGSYPGMGTSGGQYVLSNVIYDHHNNVPISYQQHSQSSQVSPIEEPPPSSSSNGPQSSSNYSSQRHYDRNYCPAWHGSDPKPNFVHNSHNIPPPIVSSQMSYTTPIVPDSSNPPRVPEATVVNGMLIKMEMERGVPEGASSSPRVILDSQYHSSSRDSGLLHNHPPQAMNVST